MKIYFTNNWGEKDKLLGGRMITNTPNNLGKWKKIEYCKNLDNADYVVSLGGLNKSINLKNKKTIILQREPLALKKFKEKKKNKNILYFSYKKLHHAWTHSQFMQIDFDHFLIMKYDSNQKYKKISTITSMKRHTEISKLRVEFIKKFCKKYPDIIDVYGFGWDNSLGNNYKGILPFTNGKNDFVSENINNTKSKFEGLRNYKYSLCIENSCYDNYFTEKITDCLLSWTIPIYFGCTNIEKYFPEHSYYWIDINEPNSIDKLYEIIKKPITEKNVQAMDKARKLIMEKYNIWDLLNEIIN
jgi:hypothetical protein